MSTETPKNSAQKPATKKPASSSSKKPAAKKPAVKKPAPQRISEVSSSAQRVVEQAPEVSTISLPAIPVSLTSNVSTDMEASLRAVLSGETPAIVAPNEDVVVAEVEEIVVEEFDSVDTGSLPTRRDRLSGEPSNKPEPVSMLTPERVLDAKKKRDAPTEGWNKFVYDITFHGVNLGDSPVTRHRKALDASIGRTLSGGTKFIPVLTRKGGVGKTTTIGKLSKWLVQGGFKVLIGAADTFRAAAVDQVATWAERAGASLVRPKQEGQDPASVAFEATEEALVTSSDILIIDTAGRLQNKADLMNELDKIRRVIEKKATIAEVLLVIDATTGQNGLAQAKAFTEVAKVTGVVLTKLDGTAKGGIVYSIQQELGIPVKLVGVGEGIDDFAFFDAQEFASGLVGQEG